MLRSIAVAGAVIVAILTLALTSMMAVDAANASTPKEVTFESGTVCSLKYDPRGGGTDDIVILEGNGIPTFTLRYHHDWSHISFYDAAIPVDGVWPELCPVSYPPD